MALARRLHLDLTPPRIEWASARWLFPYLVGLSGVFHLGNFGRGGVLGGGGPFRGSLVGGRGVIPLWWDLACLTMLGATFVGAMAQGSRAPARARHGGLHPAARPAGTASHHS